jgi:hypothetical protein
MSDVECSFFVSEGESTYKCVTCVKALPSVGDEKNTFTELAFFYLGASEDSPIYGKGAYFARVEGFGLSQCSAGVSTHNLVENLVIWF